MNKIDWYISRELLTKTVATGTWLLCIYAFVSLIEVFESYGDELSTLNVAKLMLLALPTMLYQLAPMMLLIGILLGLAALSQNLELVAMMAGGISRRRIAASVIGFSTAFAVVMFAWGELVVPDTARLGEQVRQLHEGVVQDDAQFWLRDGNQFVNYRGVSEEGQMRFVKVFEFDDSGQLKKAITADSAQFEEGSEKQVLLLDVVERELVEGTLATVNHGRIQTELDIDRQTVELLGKNTSQMSIWQLLKQADFLEVAGQETRVYELEFWNRIILPLSIIAMVAIIIPFGFRTVRHTGFQALLGLVIGLAYIAVQQSAGYIVLLNGLSPLYGAAFVLGVVSIGAVATLYKL